MHRAEASSAIRVCVDQTNPTSIIDADIARAAVATQGYAIEEVRFVGHGKEADDGFPIGRFARMAKSDCQLIMGFPVDVGSPHLPPGVQSTPPYASTGFVLVERGRGEPTPLEQLPNGSEVGIAQLDTWAGMLFSTHPNIVMHVYAEDAEMLADLQNKRITAGLTWQPFLHGWELGHGGGSQLTARVLPGKHMLWNLVALYAADAQHSADIFARGLDALRASGKLEKLIKPYQAAAAAPKSSLLTPAKAVAAQHVCAGKKKAPAGRARASRRRCTPKRRPPGENRPISRTAACATVR